MATPSIATQLALLAGTVERLSQQLDRDRDDRKADAEKAATHQNEAEAALHRVEEAQRDMLRRVGQIEPVVEMVTGWRARALGGLFVLGLIGSVFLLFKAEVWKVFHLLLTGDKQ